MSAIYPGFGERVLSGQIDLTGQTVRAALINAAAYVYSPAHTFWSSVPSGAIVGTSQTLAGKAVVGGVFDAGDVSFPGVSGTVTADAMIIFVDTGSAATSPLVAYIDELSGFPVTPNGGDVSVAWDNGADRIFAIV